MANPSPKTFLLVRHAHRDVTDRFLDNGLSDKGHAQAKSLINETAAWIKGWGSQPIVLVSSPRLRCIETLAPLSQKTGSEIQIWKELDEQAAHETQERFVARVRAALKRIDALSQKSPVLACSHGDWIPVAGDLLSGVSVHLRKGEWIELALKL